MSKQITIDLEQHNVQIIDLNPEKSASPPLSSIIVTQNTGERAVISLNGTRCQGKLEQIPLNILNDIDLILIDGHQMQVSQEIVKQANLLSIPVVLDGGSWKEGFEQVLPYVDYAICSANFLPPQCHAH